MKTIEDIIFLFKLLGFEESEKGESDYHKENYRYRIYYSLNKHKTDIISFTFYVQNGVFKEINPHIINNDVVYERVSDFFKVELRKYKIKALLNG